MFFGKKEFIALFVLIVTLSACHGSSQDMADSSQVAAKVNDKEITTSYLQRRIKQLPPQVRGALKSGKGQKEFVDSLVSKELFLQAAKKEGLHKSYVFATRVQDFKNDLLIQLYLRKKMLKNKSSLIPTEEEVRNFYNKHISEFKEQPEVRISHIFLTSRVEAEDIREKLKKGGDFARLAYEKSTNRATAQRGGDMGFRRKWQFAPDLAKTIFSLKAGEISEIIPVNMGFTLLKVTEKRTGKEVPLKAVANAIKKKIMTDRQKKWIQDSADDLKKKAKVVINESVLSTLSFSQGENLSQTGKPVGAKKE
ncbi:MAG: peptidyl-prolyl cis-trans isomerase [bacterium]